MVKLADGREFDPTVYNEKLRYNTYTCPQGHINLSVDLDKGVTPMFLTCRRKDQTSTTGICGLTAESSMYPWPPPPKDLFPVRIVWRSPTQGERKREKREGNGEDHYLRGGLALEWINDRAD